MATKLRDYFGDKILVEPRNSHGGVYVEFRHAFEGGERIAMALDAEDVRALRKALKKECVNVGE